MLLKKGGGQYVRCTACGFIYAHPRRDVDDRNEDLFTGALESYVDRAYGKKRQKMYRALLRRLEPYRRTGRLLELGCNVGGFLFESRDRGWHPTGIEPVGACARYATDTHGLDVLCGTAETVELPDDAFDVVCSNAVFEHLASPRKVMEIVHAALRPGGALWISTLNFDSYTCEALGENWRLLEPDGHLSIFTPGTLSRLCSETGFEVLETSTRGVRLDADGGPVRKTVLSAVCRFNHKGDRVSVLARKPATESP